MCFLVIKHNFQKPVYQQCGIADQEMCLDPFRKPVVYGRPSKFVFIIRKQSSTWYLFCDTARIADDVEEIKNIANVENTLTLEDFEKQWGAKRI